MPTKSSAQTDYANITGVQTAVDVGRLRLDPENPRLASFDVTGSKEILQALVEQQSVDEVALSIAENGFYTTERLLVVEVAKGEPDFSSKETRYYVVEGNRRLAAVQLLLDRKLQQELKVHDLPALTTARRAELASLPVAIFESRQRLWPYLGFRHVNGPRSWDAIDKAQFIAHVHEDYGIPLDEVTRRIGDRFATVRKMYLGYKLLRQAEKAGVFNREDRYRDRRFPFSHLYTAAEQTPYQDFLGITPQRLERPEPVPRAHIQDLSDLLLWIYGSKSTQTQPVVQTQAPDLNYLREVVRSPDAVAALRSGRTLEAARRVALGADRLLRDALVSARESLQDASGLIVTGYKGEPDLRALAESAQELANDLVLRMDRVSDSAVKPRPARRQGTRARS